MNQRPQASLALLPGSTLACKVEKARLERCLSDGLVATVDREMVHPQARTAALFDELRGSGLVWRRACDTTRLRDHS
jgi:hypothetical protein